MQNTNFQVIVTAPPYADYLDEAAAHPLVCGFRLNTVMPVKGGPNEALNRLKKFELPVWVDLKGRQLRVVGSATPPFTAVRISHPIRVQTPVDVFFSDGTEHAKVVAVEGDKLILADGPRRVVGPGESVNIIHPSLEILGTLTKTDKSYLSAMKDQGIKKVMLSYVEQLEDVTEVKSFLPDAEVLAKIETQKGLKYINNTGYAQDANLIAARGDLYIEVLHPHKIIEALKDIIQADPNAMVASRILDSLAFHPVPTSADISDIAFLISLGYKTFILGDYVSLQRDSLIEALNLLEKISA